MWALFARNFKLIFMKKVHYIILLLFFLLIISFLLPYFTHLNRSLPNDSDMFFNQKGTTWKSDNPEIKVSVDENNRAYGTILIENESMYIEFFYAELNVVMFEDIAKRDAGGYLSSEIDIIIGECKFSETKLEIKVTKSNINEIESGDEIILYRED